MSKLCENGEYVIQNNIFGIKSKEHAKHVTDAKLREIKQTLYINN